MFALTLSILTIISQQSYSGEYYFLKLTSNSSSFNRAIVIITILLYFVAHRSDPGFIPHDAIFFTEQEEPSHCSPSTTKYYPSSPDKTHLSQRKLDSIMGLKKPGSNTVSMYENFSPNATQDRATVCY